MSTNPNKPKDPKKVAAGKARAAKALRDEGGRLTSNSFKDEVKKIADQTGLSSGRSLQDFYLQNSEDISKYLSKGITSQNRYAISTIDRTLHKTSKDTFLYYDGETFKASPERIAYEMANFEQYCYSNRNATGVAWKKSRRGTGEPIVKIPDTGEDVEEMDDIEFIEHCFDFGVIVWISDLSKLKDKKKRLKRTAQRESKIFNAKAIIKENKPRRTRKGKRGAR